MLFRCYSQLIVEGMVPDLEGTKAREAQQTPRDLEKTGWPVHTGDGQPRATQDSVDPERLVIPGISDPLPKHARPRANVCADVNHLTLLLPSSLFFLLFCVF